MGDQTIVRWFTITFIALCITLSFSSSLQAFVAGSGHSWSFADFTTTIQSIKILRPTVVIDVDDYKPGSQPESGAGGDLQRVLSRLPAVEKGLVEQLRVVLLSSAAGWRLTLDTVMVRIDDFKADQGGAGTITAHCDFQYPQRSLSAAGSFELQLAVQGKMVAGSGMLALNGTLNDSSYTLAIPLELDRILKLSPRLTIAGGDPVESLITCELPTDASPSWRFEIGGKNATCNQLQEIVSLVQPGWAAILPGAGTADYKIAVQGRDKLFQAPYTALLSMQAQGLRYQSPDGTMVMEEVGCSLEASISVPDHGEGSLSLTVDGHGGPGLWRDYFWDFSDQKIVGNLQAVCNVRDGRPVFASGVKVVGRLSDSPLWVGKLHGRWTPDEWSAVFDGQRMDLARLLAVWMPEFLGGAPPGIVKELSVAGHGQLSAAMRKTGDQIVVTGGTARLAVSEFSAGRYGRLLDSSLEIPLDGLAWNGKTRKIVIKEYSAPSTLVLGTLTGDYVETAGPQDFHLAFSNDGFAVAEPLAVTALGCPVTVFGIRTGAATGEKNIALQVAVSPAIAGHPLPSLPLPDIAVNIVDEVRQGINANLQLVLAGEQVTTEGSIAFPLFHGQVTLDKIRLRRPFSPSRVMGMNCRAEKLDLQEITAQVPVGSASGIIDLQLNNLELSYGQPSSFDLEVRSVKRSGVPRTISVKAIENLSMLSSGTSAGQGLLNVGINRFFKHYRYSAIGLRCSLRDDMFHLRGLIHQGGREYVVKRGLLTGVDVINHRPDNQISFRDMQKRINRIFNKP
ncbi:MAG: hypothetical protein JXO49_02670 [Deltaproteobacteria bacterium]|nr:hypothetical protein [Candidatus Anaeroferrophillus wilburensis]MBN2888232.1 hypothetical protein [Deltaproteobacteria bacterium]